jgi:hypothetical protein
MLHRLSIAAALAAAVMVGPARADLTAGLAKGSVELKSPGPMTFGPDNVLFVGDIGNATIFAIGTGDQATGDRKAALNIEKLDVKVAEMLGGTTKDFAIRDLKVNPATGNVFLTVARNAGGGTILRIDKAGKITEQALKDIPCARFVLSKLPKAENRRTQSMTCLAFVKDRLFVAGLSNEEFNSTLRSIPFPFKESDQTTPVEIYHGSHGKWETASPVRTFLACEIAGQNNLLAAYTCTPLVKFPVDNLKAGEKIRGVTVAELGNFNQPLAMVEYQKDGKSYILIGNTSRGVMKIAKDDLIKADQIPEARVPQFAGTKYQTVLKAETEGDVESRGQTRKGPGEVRLDRLNDSMIVMTVKTKAGIDLKSVELP